jgi:sugar lactone lactonase YvrE
MTMAATNYLPDVLETTEPERLATGFLFTEGPLWHPDGFWYFVDLRRNRLHRLTPARSRSLSGRPAAAMARPSTCRGGLSSVRATTGA